MNLVERVKNILLQPKSEWAVIEREPGDAGYLFTNYICIVSAIPPVCSFIGGSIIGYGPFHLGIVTGLVHAIVIYVLGLVGVFVMAYIIDFLAGVFDGQKNLDNAMKVSAFAPTAAWVCGVFNLIPLLAVLMKPPAGKAVVYTIAVVVVLIVVWFVVFGIVGAIFGLGMISRY